jgi:predicted GNAT superfamily acetyltransferase
MPDRAVRCRVASQFRSPVCPAMPLDLHDRSRASDSAGPDAETTRHAGLTYRAFASREDADACVALQAEVWGSAFDHVPASLLRVATKIGGLAIGAFDATGALVGFVFSLAGTYDGEPIQWSHMLGVREDVRGLGVGRHLKELQQAEAARSGVRRVLWTFDPLQARNAHLNFNRLGVRLIDYVENMYGITASPLHLGLATDRLIVTLPTAPADRQPAKSGNGITGAHGAVPVLTPFPRAGDVLIDLDDTAAPAALIEIPVDLQQVMATAPEVAGTWRLATRASFLRALGRGYTITGLRRDVATNRAFYTLVGPPTG